MNTAMRDLERIEERTSDHGRGVLVLSSVGLLAAIGIVLAAVAALPDDEPRTPEDPLQTLALTEIEPQSTSTAERAIDPATLSFPTTLVSDERPEVAAAVAAAGAELAHLDPLTDRPARTKIAAGLPAAVTAGPDRAVVEHGVVSDPLMAATIPQAMNARETASPGREGLYTLQVISYKDPGEARVFADALRKRGHAAYVTSGIVEGRGKHWRVRVGPFDTRREAQSYRATFESEEGMNTFVVRRRD